MALGAWSIELFQPVPAAVKDPLARRGAELLAFAAPAGAAQQVRIAVAA